MISEIHEVPWESYFIKNPTWSILSKINFQVLLSKEWEGNTMLKEILKKIL
jgi:hypothetical protein